MTDRPTMWWAADGPPDTLDPDLAVQVAASDVLAAAEHNRQAALDQLARMLARHLTVADVVAIMRRMPHDDAVEVAGAAFEAGLFRRGPRP